MIAELRLPASVAACLFDLDGVLTNTAVLHAAAWKETFEELGHTFSQLDYDRYVDGRERDDGVRAFLASRGVTLNDAVVHAVGARKNARVLELIREQGVEPYDDAVELVRAADLAGLALAVVSSSTNCAAVLDAAGLGGCFETIVVPAPGLAGKPAPDMFLEAARRLGVQPACAAVFEDALVGVEAGRAGGFRPVIGVDRTGERDALLAHGADIVVERLDTLLR
jgi:beta-phosphoglucomutase family hydrolase